MFANWLDLTYSCSAPVRPTVKLRTSGNFIKSTMMVSLWKGAGGRSDGTELTYTLVTTKEGPSLAATLKKGHAVSGEHSPHHSPRCLCTHSVRTHLFKCLSHLQSYMYIILLETSFRHTVPLLIYWDWFLESNTRITPPSLSFQKSLHFHSDIFNPVVVSFKSLKSPKGQESHSCLTKP